MPSKAEICVGHAIGFINGHTVLKKGEGFEGMYDTGDKEILREIISTDLEGAGSYFKTFFPQNIERHATTICFLVHQGKGLVWYYNPWGLNSDTLHHHFLQVTDLDAKAAIEHHTTESDAWARELPKSHIMFTLQAMKLTLGKDQLEVINPLFSVPDVGPQLSGEDGLVRRVWTQKVRKILLTCSGRYGGSCAVWVVMYKTLVGQILADLLEEQRSVEYIKNVVTSHMKRGIVQTLAPLESIGILTYAETKKREESDILLKVFQLLPESSEIPVEPDTMDSWYHKKARRVYRDIGRALMLKYFNNLAELRRKSIKFLSERDGPDISSRESLLRYFLRKLVIDYDARRHDSKIHEIVRLWEKRMDLESTDQKHEETLYFLHYVMMLIHCKTSRAYTRFASEQNSHGTRQRAFAHQLQQSLIHTRKRARDSSRNMYAGRTRQRIDL